MSRPKRQARSLEQLKIDAKRKHRWPWPIAHPNDERALLEGCYPEFESAERVRRFYKSLLVLPKEGGGTKPFHFLDWWYRDVIAPIFGWKRGDGRRRFDKGFITTAKKSGKTTVLAGLPLYMMMADGEEEAEAYAAATDRDQAGMIFQKTLRAVRISKHLASAVDAKESQKRIDHKPSGSWFEAISSDADSAEGKNPHLLLVDELHVWKDRQFFNSLMYGDIMRAQPLFLMITTAGEDNDCVGYEEYQFAKDLLNPDVPLYSQSHFAFIAEAEDLDRWDQPEAWLQAQPSLRADVDKKRPRDATDLPAEKIVVGNLDKLAAKCEEAKQSPRKKREFIRYICNRWVSVTDEVWLDYDAWKACGGPIPSHVGDSCYGALDLSQSKDFTALCLAFPTADAIDLLWYFWTPADKVKEHEHAWKVPLSDWIEQGWVIATPGPVIDYAAVRKEISGVMVDEEGSPLQYRSDDAVVRTYKLKLLGYDSWNARELVENQLHGHDGVPAAEHRQGYASMTGPSKEFERRVLMKKIRHGDNPVADWMARHTIVKTDPSGNIKPDKEKSKYKIDGIVTAVMAVGLATTDAKRPSVYSTRGIRTT